MYKTKNITKEALKALKIKNQDEIVDLTGSKLDPVKAWEVIKSTSEDFSKSDAKAQEKERARALDLLELELLIAA
jgi:hypothetical protein